MTTITNVEFPDLLLKLRSSRQYSVADVSKAIMVHRATYYHYEKGDRIPSVDVILRLSNLYRINPLELIYALASEDAARINKSIINYRYTNLTMYTKKELQFLQDISLLDSDEQMAILQLVKILTQSKKN